MHSLLALLNCNVDETSTGDITINQNRSVRFKKISKFKFVDASFVDNFAVIIISKRIGFAYLPEIIFTFFPSLLRQEKKVS